MEKSKNYLARHFSADVLKEVISLIALKPATSKVLRIERGAEIWVFDEDLEFFADYRKPHSASWLYWVGAGYKLQYSGHPAKGYARVTVTAKTRNEIEQVFEIFERSSEASKIVVPKKEIPKKEIKIFIGHGGSRQWLDLKNHLSDQHGLNLIAMLVA